MFERIGPRLARFLKQPSRLVPEGGSEPAASALMKADVFAPTGREILSKRLQGSVEAGDLSYQAAAHLDTPELFMARAAGYGDSEQLFLARPDVAGALDLVRQFHVQGMQAEVGQGLKRAKEFLLGNGDLKGLKALREADAIATVALATGNEAEARAVLNLVRPESGVDAHLSRLKGERSVSAANGSKGRWTRKAFPVHLELENERLDVLVANQGAQPYRNRLEIMDAIQSGKYRKLDAVRRLMLLNPRYEHELRFIEACLVAAPSRSNWTL